VHRFTGQGAAASALAFSPDGSLLLSGFVNGQIRLFDLRSGTETRAWKEHVGAVSSVAISRTGRLGLSGSSDGIVLLTNLEETGGGRIVAEHWQGVGTVAFGARDRTAVSASDDGIIASGLDTRDDLIRWTKANRHMRR
jgi:WD40 repeat protein